MTIKIYGIKNCSTMKKAFDHLTEQGIPYDFHDYKKQPIAENLIQTWVNQLGLNVVLNKKGTTYRNLTDEQKQATNDEQTAIQLVAQFPSLIKRPIIEYQKNGETHYLAGFDEEKYGEIFGK